MKKVAVVAIGGNAIMPDTASSSMEKQYENVYQTVIHIAGMMKEGWNVVIVHGNGPQVGLILRQSELAKKEVPTVPMDYAGAFTQGAIGYMFTNAMRQVFAQNSIKSEPVAMVTQTLVDSSDPAFQNPTKPVGDWYTEAAARELADTLGWHVVEDSGRGWRRVVPSPRPVGIIEIEAIKKLVSLNMPVVCVGGGGIPVIKKNSGLCGVEAVIDKDMSSALLAEKLGADMLLLPTAVEKVAIDFGKPTQKWLDKITLEEARIYLDEGQFPAGSMGPKVTALMEYVSASNGGIGVITTPQNMANAIKGRAGTHMVR